MTKIKVLFFISTLERCGPTHVVFNIIKHLDRNVIDPSIVTLSPEPANSSILEFMDLDILVKQANLNRLKWVYSERKMILDVIFEINPTVIHSHSLRADLFSALYLKSLYRISTIHSNFKVNYSNTYNSFIGSLMAIAQLNSIKRLEVPVTCSMYLYNNYRNSIKNLKCISNGIDTTIFSPLNQNDLYNQRISLGLPIDKKIFVSVGSLSVGKDPETVISGFLGSNANTDSILVLLGSGPLESELRIKFNYCSNVIFKGFVTNVSDYMRAADFFISASLSEGLPNTVLEALGCGLPVCLSGIPSHLEILDIDEQAGKIFPLKNIVRLAQCIDDLVAMDYTDTRKVASKIINENFAAQRMSSLYQKLYLNSLGNNF